MTVYSKMVDEIDEEGTEKGLFYITTLGIIFDTRTKKILIGRREGDPLTEELTWSFPGGSPGDGIDLERGVEIEVERKTGFKVKNLGSVFSRFFKENKKVIIIYYLCEVVGGEESVGASFKELRWVKPEELENYFTTSLDPRLMEYLLHLR